MQWYRLCRKHRKRLAILTAILCSAVLIYPCTGGNPVSADTSRGDAVEEWLSDPEPAEGEFPDDKTAGTGQTGEVEAALTGVTRRGAVYEMLRSIAYYREIPEETADGVTAPPKRTGWQYTGGEWFILLEDGSRFTGWTESEGEKYYFDENGWMATGWVELDGKTYFFDPRGVLAVERWVGDRYLGRDGAWDRDVVMGPPDAWHISFSCILQEPELPNGCEVTSLAMVLRYYGFEVSKTELADEYLVKGRIGSVSPNEAFLGDPRNGNTLYCYSPVIVNCAESYFESIGETGYIVEKPEDPEVEDLFAEVAEGRPVMVWVTMSMGNPIYGDGWTIDGTYYEKNRNLHCMVLTGYDKTQDLVYMADPMEGETTYRLSTFSRRFEQIGRQAVVIRPSGEQEQGE